MVCIVSHYVYDCCDSREVEVNRLCLQFVSVLPMDWRVSLSWRSHCFSLSYIQAWQFHTNSAVGENLEFADVRLGNSVYWLPLFIAFMTLMAPQLKSPNPMKITTTIDIPEETVLEAKYILLAHRNASEHRLLSSFYRGCLLALVDQCADGRLIQWPVEFVIQDRCDAHSWYAIAEKELNEK